VGEGREGGRQRGKGEGWMARCRTRLKFNSEIQYNVLMYIFFVSARVPRSVDSIHKN